MEEQRITEWIAYNGYTAKEPAHTHRAFLAAANKKFNGLLISLRFTKDDIPIASDKPYFLIKNEKVYINKFDYQELAEMGIFSYPFDLSCSLALFLQICAHYEKKPFIYLNRNTSAKQLKLLKTLLKEKELLDKIKIVAPKLDYLIYFRNIDLHLELQYEVDKYSDEVFLNCCKYHLDFYLKTGGLNKTMPHLIGLLHDFDLKIACGSSFPLNTALKYEEMQVDYIYLGEI